MPGEEAAIVFGAAALSVAGVMFALLAASTAKRAADLVSLIAGVVVLLVAIFHLAPEVIAAGAASRIFLIAGAAVGIGVEMLFRTRTDTTAPSTIHIGAWLGIAVLALHSTLDGAVYRAVFWHGNDAGLLASMGLILHEAPEGVVAAMLSLQTGLRPPAAVGVAVLASSVTTPVGWVLAHAIGDSAQGVMQLMFAASAGLLIFVGWHMIAGGWSAMRRRRAGPRA